MKNIFRKILMSVIYVMLVMPVWAKGDITIKTVDATTGKAVSGMLVEVHNNKGPYLDSADIQKFNNAKYKTGGNGSLKMPGWCSILHVAAFNITVSDASGKYSSANYTTTPQHNKTNCSDVVLKVTSKVSEEDKKKRDDVAHCATPENDPSIADVASCVNWGTSSAWKKSGTCKTSGNKNGECKAVDSGDKNYQAKKDCWIIVGSSRLYLPKPDGKNIYRCVATQKTETSTTTISVSGRVVDAETNEGLPNANLKMVKSNNSVIPNANCQADIDGKFSCKFDSMPTGAKLQASYTSYNAQSLAPKQDMLFKLESTETKSTETKSPEKNNPGQSGTPDISTGNGENNQPQTPDDAIQPVVNVVPEIPVVVAPKPATMTGDTIIKSLAVRLALDNDAPSQMDKNKFADLLGAADNISIREILIACIKSMPADVACNQCEAFIRSMVNYHNNN